MKANLLIFLTALSTAVFAGPLLPDLSRVKAFQGRPATQADVDAGIAIFRLIENGKIIGQPVPIELPQYALYTAHGTEEPVILVQVERAGNDVYYGAVNVFGKPVLSLGSHIVLMGNKNPGPHNKSFKADAQPLRGWPRP
jgi:hypothetical protein